MIVNDAPFLMSIPSVPLRNWLFCTDNVPPWALTPTKQLENTSFWML